MDLLIIILVIICIIYLYLNAKKASEKYAAVKNAILAEITYNNLDSQTKEKVLNGVIMILKDGGIRNPSISIRQMNRLQKYCFSALSMLQLGIMPSLKNERWEYVKNPFLSTMDTEKQLQAASYYFMNNHNISISLEDGSVTNIDSIKLKSREHYKKDNIMPDRIVTETANRLASLATNQIQLNMSVTTCIEEGNIGSSKAASLRYNFKILYMFLCDIACYIKIDSRVTKESVLDEFYRLTLDVIIDSNKKLEIENIINQYGKLYIGALKINTKEFTDLSSTFYKHISNVFLYNINEENNKSLSFWVSSSAMGFILAIFGILDEMKSEGL
jgi:hypothetical protein